MLLCPNLHGLWIKSSNAFDQMLHRKILLIRKAIPFCFHCSSFLYASLVNQLHCRLNFLVIFIAEDAWGLASFHHFIINKNFM